MASKSVVFIFVLTQMLPITAAMTPQYSQAARRLLQPRALQRVARRAIQSAAPRPPIMRQPGVAGEAAEIGRQVATTAPVAQEQLHNIEWNRWTAPMIGAITAGTVIGTTAYQILIDRNHQMQEELQRDLEESLKRGISGIHFTAAEEISNPLVERIRSLPIPAKDQFRRALKKEAELLGKGYICFYHAQQSIYGSINDVLNTVFFKLADQSQPDDFRFIQIRPSELQKRSIFSRNRAHAMAMQGDYNIRRTDQLSVNLFAFGNTGHSFDEGSSTLRFLTDNRSFVRFNPDIVMQALSAMGLPANSTANLKSLILRLEELDNKVHKTGRLLLIAVPEAKIDQNVFTVVYNESKDRRTPISIGGKIVHNTSEVIQMLQRPPEALNFFTINKMECAIPLDAVGLLNPYSGIKVFAIDSAPTSKAEQQELDRAKAELVDAIMAAFQKTGNLQKGQEIVRGYMQELPVIANQSYFSMLRPEYWFAL